MIWKIIFMLFWVGFCIVRAPHTKRHLRREEVISKRMSKEKFLVLLIGFGMIAMPLMYVFTAWLDYFNMNLPEWSRWIGAICLATGLILLWWTHRMLGQNWSPVLEIRETHKLITKGPYKHIRHPMYTFFWIWLIGQWLISSNWLVGLIGVAPWTILYFSRVGPEERMMIEAFGEKYENYMKNTGRLLPKLRSTKL